MDSWVERHDLQRYGDLYMTFLDTIMQRDWTRAARMWVFVAGALAACEAACLFRRAFIAYWKGADDVR
jgi:hypothetical protein